MSSLIRKINIQFDLTTGLTTDYKQPARQVWAGSGRSGDVRRPRGRAPVIVTGILSDVSRQHDESGVEYAGEERRSTNSSNRCVGPHSDTRQRRYSVDLTTTTHSYGYTRNHHRRQYRDFGHVSRFLATALILRHGRDFRRIMYKISTVELFWRQLGSLDNNNNNNNKIIIIINAFV